MTQDVHDHTLADAICRHLADSVARPGSHATATGAAEAPAEGWHVRLAVQGRGFRYVWLALGSKDVTAISKRILGVQDEEIDEGVLRDTLRELVAQAVSAATQEPAGSGLNIQIEAVESSLVGSPSTPPHVHAFDIGEGATLVLAAWSSPRPEEAAAAAAEQARGEQLRGDGGNVGQGSPGTPENLDLVLDIDLPMSVRFGRTEMALAALTHLGPGSVIDLGRSPDEPVEMIVSGRVVARGDVVVVGGNFGVRITDVLHVPASRRD